MKILYYKSKRFFLLSSLLTVYFLSMLTLPALADRDGGRGHGKKGWGWGHDGRHGHGGISWIAEELKLTTEQSKQLKTLMEEVKDKAHELKEDREDGLDGLSDEIKKDSFDAAWFDAKIQQHEQSTTELYKLMAQNFAKFHALLNAEQREELADYMERFEFKGWFR